MTQETIPMLKCVATLLDHNGNSILVGSHSSEAVQAFLANDSYMEFRQVAVHVGPIILPIIELKSLPAAEDDDLGELDTTKACQLGDTNCESCS